MFASLLTRSLHICEQECSRSPGCKLVGHIVGKTLLSASFDDGIVGNTNSPVNYGDGVKFEISGEVLAVTIKLPPWLSCFGNDPDMFDTVEKGDYIT